MNILYITTSFERKADSATIRNNAWVNGLIEIGCNVTVLTVDWPKHLKSFFLIRNNVAKVERTLLNNLKVLNITTSSRSRRLPKWVVGFRHFVRDIIYFPDICKPWSKQIECNNIDEYDVVISSSDLKSSHFAAYKLLRNRKSRIRWIQIWGDPWYTDINIGRIHKIPAKIYEKKFIKEADAVIYVSELTKQNMQNAYPKYADKIHYIPRGFYKSVIKQDIRSDRFSVCYTGVLSKNRSKYVIPFIEEVEKYNCTSGKKITIDFYGDYDVEIIHTLDKFECCNIHSHVDYEDILKLYASSGALLFISNSSRSTQIPGKLFDYMGTQLPIICLLDEHESLLGTMLSQYEKCVVTKYDDCDGIAESLQFVINHRVHKFDINEEFSPKAIASQLVDLIS